MSIRYQSLKRLWDAGRATENTIQAAVDKGWITQDEANDIMGIVEEESAEEETPAEENTENTETANPTEE